MSRFETQFATLNAKNEGAFVPFVTLCDPSTALLRSFAHLWITVQML